MESLHFEFHNIHAVYKIIIAKVNLFIGNSICTSYIVHSPSSGNYYEKVRTANAVFSLVQNSLTTGRYFPLQPVVKEDGSFASKHRRTGKAKKKVSILIYRIFRDSFFKSCTNSTIKRRRFFSTFPYSYLVRIPMIQFFFGKFFKCPGNKNNNNCFFPICTTNVVFSHGAQTNCNCIYCSDMLKTYRRETKFSRDTNKKELEIR